MASELQTSEKVRLYKLFGDGKMTCFQNEMKKILKLSHTKEEMNLMKIKINEPCWSYAYRIKMQLVHNNKIPEFLMASDVFLEKNQNINP